MRFRRDGIGFWMIVIAACVVLVYARSPGNGFVDFDDGGLIVRPAVSHGLSVANIVRAFTQYDPELYIPFTFISYQIDYSIGGLAPWIYHVHAVLLFALASAFMAWAFWLLGGRGTWVAAVAGLLYALHPIQSEAVLWAAARKDVQAAMFFWLACALYLKARDEGSRRWFAAGLLAFLAALLSKVSVIVLPALLLLFDWYREGKLTVRSLMRAVPYGLLSVIFGIVALFGKGEAGSGLPVEKALIGAKATVFYLWKLVLPAGFSVMYPYTEHLSVLTPDLLVAVILVAFATGAAILFRRRYPAFTFAWFFYVLCLLPSFSNFAKGSEPPYDVYIGSDRYALLGTGALFFVAALLLGRWKERHGTGVTVATGAVLAVLATLTFLQVPVWRNDETLFSHALTFYPNAQAAHINLGAVYFRRGEIDRALAGYQSALAIRPSAAAHFNLGQVYRELGNDNLAMEHYREAARLNPLRADAFVNLSVICLERRMYAEAADALQKAEAADRTLALIPFNLGLAYEGLGNKELAIAAFKRALELDPSDREAQDHLRTLEGKK